MDLGISWIDRLTDFSYFLCLWKYQNMVLLSFEPRYHQISAIFQAFLLNFPCSIFLYFFPLEVVQYLSNNRLVSFMEILPFLSLIYHIQNTINTEKLLDSNNKKGSSVARCWHSTWEGGVQFPAQADKAFSFVSYLNSRHQWKKPQIHRYLYIKNICDVITQYLGD